MLDRAAMGLSGLCVIHCVASAALLGLLASAGVLGNPLIHEVGLTLAMLIGAYALGRGLLEHGFLMPASIGSLGLGVMTNLLLTMLDRVGVPIETLGDSTGKMDQLAGV